MKQKMLITVERKKQETDCESLHKAPSKKHFSQFKNRLFPVRFSSTYRFTLSFFCSWVKYSKNNGWDVFFILFRFKLEYPTFFVLFSRHCLFHSFSFFAFCYQINDKKISFYHQSLIKRPFFLCAVFFA